MRSCLPACTIELEAPCYLHMTYDCHNYVWMLQLKQVCHTHTCHPVVQTDLSTSSRCTGTQSSVDCNQMLQCRNRTGWRECLNEETGLLPIRMEWWQDAVNSVFRNKPVKRSVIQALAQVSPLALHLSSFQKNS